MSVPANLARLGSALVSAIAIVSCAVGPNYRTPDAHVPAKFEAVSGTAKPVGRTGDNTGTDDLSRTDNRSGADGHSSSDGHSSPDGRGSPEVDLATWWHALHDPELDSLIDRAVRSNPDVQIALDRLQAARTYEIAIVGSVLPDVQASGAAARGTGSDLGRGRADQSLISADSSSGVQHINQIGGFDSVWEIDLFGKYRREMQAARFDAQASAAQRNAVLITVISDVARAYVDLRGLQMRASVLHASIDTLRESQRVTRERYERGITNELDVTLATRELGVLESQVAPVEAQVNAAEYTIATLLGQYPEDLVAELHPAAMIPSVPAAVQAGLPLDLLRRRPEIIQAERELAGSTARLGVATANLFPQISLSAAIGAQRQTAPMVGTHIWSAGVGAVWPLLDFGSLDAQVETADLRTRAQLVNYRRTIQDAVKEVDTTWTAYAAQQERLAKLGDALVASQRAVTLANERYVRGLTDFLNLVDAEREEYDIEEQYTAAQLGAAEQFIALYRSLGGGWENYQSLPPVHVPQPAVIAAFHRVLAPAARSRNEVSQ
jgi:NodT family efflux transporter outer membrane factor (OMF) lipoprotein